MDMDQYLPIKVSLSTAAPDLKTEILFGFATDSFSAVHPFGKKPGDVNLIRFDAGRQQIHVSLGKEEDFNLNTIREAAGLLAKWLISNKVPDVKFEFDPSILSGKAGAINQLVEGLESGGYKFSAYKTDKESKRIQPGLVVVTSKDIAQYEEEIKHTLHIMSAVNLSRDWANEPANVINPVSLRKMVADLFEGTPVSIKVVDEKQLGEIGAVGILSVGKGSETPPCFIILSYPGSGPDTTKKPLVVIGKTITFDTGGYSLKDSTYIQHMKLDKCGGMDVVGLLLAAEKIKLSQPLIGIVTAAENMISAQAYRPDDIIRTLSGKTVEIGSTDAEGRLVLADALTYAQSEYKPDLMIDLATLTGGVLVALGRVRAGLMSNNDKLADDLFKAGERTHERLWRMPMDKEYAEMMEGDEADLKNVSGSREASTITGGTFLKEFVSDDVAWAHIDIAGTADTPRETPLSGKGATGFGIRMLLDFLEKQ
ncbi:MAG: M17 family metallopeptidase [Anaerolineaceae bacterium]